MQISFEELGKLIPGFGGYKDKGKRKESDTLLREALAGELKGISGEMESAFSDIVESEITRSYPIMRDANALMDRLIGRMETEDYGNAGFFGAPEIGEDVLDSVYGAEKKLFDEIDLISDQVDALSSAAEAEETESVVRVAKELRKALMDFEKMLDKRKAILLKLE